MAMIEGVGDEVVLLLGALMVILVLFLAWASTRTSDPPTAFNEEQASATDTENAPSSSVSAEPPLVPKQGEGVRSRGNGQPSSSSSSNSNSNIGGDEQRNSLVLRLKFLNDTERTATVSPQDTVGHIKRTYFCGQESRVRLIFQGQLLDDDSATVSALHLSHNCVLHCHVSQHPSTRLGPTAGEQTVGVALNVGSLMVPLLVLMLAVLWYCQIQYRQFFTAPATATLAGLTVVLSVVAFGVYRR